MDNSQIKETLKNYYAESAPAPSTKAKEAAVVAVEQIAGSQRFYGTTPTSFWRFTIGQLRFIDLRIWAVQLAVLVSMFAIVLSYGSYDGSAPVVMAAAILSVAIAIPTACKSFECKVSELEYSCMHNCMQVLASRLILFGLADVFWVTASVIAIPTLTGIDAMRIFLYAATPFFCFCAVCLYAARVTRGNSTVACLTSAVIAVLALWGVSMVFPHWYTELSLLMWAIALVIAVALAVYEGRRLMAQVTSGLVAKTANYAL